MFKVKLFNYITLVCAILTICSAIYNIYAKANPIYCIILLLITLVMLIISNKINENLTKKDMDLLNKCMKEKIN